MNLSRNSFYVANILNLFFLKYFDCYLLPSEIMVAQLDLSEGAFTDGLTFIWKLTMAIDSYLVHSGLHFWTESETSSSYLAKELMS